MCASVDRSWLHPRITGIQAEQLLKSEGKVGSFLIRPSQSGVDAYSLSVRLADHVTHIRIHNDGEGFDLLAAGGERFSSLCDLVGWYMEGGTGYGTLVDDNGEVIDLRFPLPVTYEHGCCTERFFHRDLSEHDAEASLEPMKPGWFLVRQSKSNRNNFVLSIRTDDERQKFLQVLVVFQNERFNIGDGFSFCSLARLVTHYRSNEITDKSGIKVMLKQAVNMTKFRLSDIAKRVAQLEQPIGVDGDTRDGFREEFDYLQSQEESCDHQFSVGTLPENRKKNRYRNILPFDHTRVKLRHVNPQVPASDYINANYVTIDLATQVRGEATSTSRPTRTYIATQGCLPNTIVDFWQMVWQENCSIIVMLTELVECGKAKCAQYWPEEEEPAMKLDVHNRRGSLIVETMRSDNDQETKDWILRVLRVSLESNEGKIEELRFVYHYHYLEWPDKRVPTSADAGTVLNFMHRVRKRWLADARAVPLVVHCSAGIGRTGTFITIDILISEFLAKGNHECEIDVSKTIQLLRQCRPGFVQVWQQYRFVYIAIERFIESQPASSHQKQPDTSVIGRRHETAAAASHHVTHSSAAILPLEGPALDSSVASARGQSSTQKATKSSKPVGQLAVYENVGPILLSRLK